MCGQSILLGVCFAFVTSCRLTEVEGLMNWSRDALLLLPLRSVQPNQGKVEKFETCCTACR